MDPTVAREPVPEQLELISKDLLAPLHGIFHHLVQQVIFYIECRHQQQPALIRFLRGRAKLDEGSCQDLGLV